MNNVCVKEKKLQNLKLFRKIKNVGIIFNQW